MKKPGGTKAPSLANQVKQLALEVKAASPVVMGKSEGEKNALLALLAKKIRQNQDGLIKENEKDLKLGKKAGLNAALMDRLALTPSRIEAMAQGVETVMALPDPIGEILAGWRRPNGLEISQIRVPLGVVGMIYESRPNVTVDAAVLCLKSGNAVLLKGGKEAHYSNQALEKIIVSCLKEMGWPEKSVALIPHTDRAATKAMMGLRGILDVLIPRGGSGLIQAVVQNAKVPTLETGVGNCHLFVDKAANLEDALNIALNAKTQRPGVCNAIETLLVHEDIAQEFLPLVGKALEAKGVELRNCPRTKKLIGGKAAKASDWAEEFHELILAVKVVKDVDEAILHIRQYGTQHSETILSNHLPTVEKFSKEVDAADIFINCSSRFADGGEYGFGAEIGIATQKLHARGPMGLKALTTTKYIVRGQGQVRP